MPKEHYQYQSARDFLDKDGLRPRPEAPSLVGQRFKLKERTLAIELSDSRRRAITIPAGSIIGVVAGAGVPSSNDIERTIHVLWGDRKCEIFTCDVNMRGMVIGVDRRAKDSC